MGRKKSKSDQSSGSDSDDISRSFESMSFSTAAEKATRSGTLKDGEDIGEFSYRNHGFRNRGHNVRSEREKLGRPLKPTFSRKDKLPSAIKIQIPGENSPCLVFPRWQLDMLTHGYDPEIQASIHKVIKDYFASLQKKLSKAHKEAGREPRKENADKPDKGDRGHLRARGCVYLLMPEPSEIEFEEMNTEDRLACEKGVLIKIGYSRNLRQRLNQHKTYCKVDSDPIATFPETRIDDDTNLRGIGFVYLLEKILHQIWTLEQRDIPCLCGKNKNKGTGVAIMTLHTEIFVFERKEDKTHEDAFKENVRLMEPHIMKWMNAIKSLESLYKKIIAFHSAESGESDTESEEFDDSSEESDDSSEESDDSSEESDTSSDTESSITK
ncbi:hypothetical protein BGX26_004269 [Mortierella sp. AD094]|nr:hypothetical protein BGX26_004269 [Mortierella sp. AD094]